MTYEIKRWDGVLFGNSITKVPMLYIEPDLNFLTYAKDNDYTINISISNTGGVYDLKNVVGTVNKSSDIPNCRPNFFEKTNLYVITLYAEWNGYPPIDQLGTINVIGMKSPDTAVITSPLTTSQSINNNNEDNDEHKKSIWLFLGLFLGLFTVYILLAYWKTRVK